MPSFTSMLTASALVLLSSHLVAAAPLAPAPAWGRRGRPTPVQDLTLPTTGGSTCTIPTALPYY